MNRTEARREHYRRLARERGYRSRAAFKLKELNSSYRIIGPGSSVLDLGCAPGGWLQVAVQLAGNRGRVVGVDVSYVEDVPGATVLRGDIGDEQVRDAIAAALPGGADAVVCDLSPRVIGNWTVDHARQISLNYDAARVADAVLSRGGNSVFKVFDGEYATEFRDYMAGRFARVRLTKPQASRKASSELYLACLGHRG